MPVVQLPITQVTCLEDRAQVERRGQVALGSGTQALRVETVSSLAVDRSLQVQLAGATVVDARVVRVWKEKPAGGLSPDASGLRQREHALRWELAAANTERARCESRRQAAEAALQRNLEQVAQAAGVGAVKSEWGAELAAAREREEKAAAESHAANHAAQKLNRQHADARAALGRAEQPEPELDCAVELVVECQEATQASLRLSYLVPCAAWRPAYRASLRPAPEGKWRVALSCEAVVWQRTGEEWKDVALAFSTARPTLGSAPPQLVPDWLSLRAKAEREKKAIDVSVREEVIQAAGEGAAVAAEELPGLDDGGDVRLLAARSPASVPSEGQPYRVPLFEWESVAEVQLLATPERSPLVSLVARFPNAGKDVLLAGPVELVRQSGYVGRGELKFTGVGEMAKVSFGSEDALRVARQPVEKREVGKLTGKQTLSRKVMLYLSNAGGEATKVAVEERIPVSEVSAVEVKVLEAECVPRPTSVSKDGIVRFELSLPARTHQELCLAYEVVAASKVHGL